MSADPDCLFCKIVAGEVPGEFVADNSGAVAFRDVKPQAPTHVLVVPRDHHPDVGALAAADPGAMAEVVRLTTTVAESEQLSAHRVVFNTGAGAGQSVFHCHAHVLGGRSLGWPPG
ncbi:MAG: HIT domain-containing protein [Nocardioidaceae bacterium]